MQIEIQSKYSPNPVRAPYSNMVERCTSHAVDFLEWPKKSSVHKKVDKFDSEMFCLHAIFTQQDAPK